MTGCGECVELCLCLLSDRAQRYCNEHTIIAVNIRASEWLAIHGKYSLALLSGAFGNQLFDPQAECFEFLIDDESELVASLICIIADCNSQLQRGIDRLCGETG